MNNVTITEKYALCMLKEKKNLYETELVPHLFISMIIEMMLDGNLEITKENKVKLKDEIPSSDYNKQLYHIIKDMKKEEISLKNIITSICNGFTNQKMKSVIELLKDNMVKHELIVLEEKKGLFAVKEVITINENMFTNIIEEIRAEFLEKGNLTEDIILLCSLLNSTKFLKNIFTKYEKETLNNRLQEINDTEIAERVKVARSVIDDMSAVMAAIIFTTMN